MRDECSFDQTAEEHVQQVRRDVLPGLRVLVSELADRTPFPADVAQFMDALPEVLVRALESEARRAFLCGAYLIERYTPPRSDITLHAGRYAYIVSRVARDEFVRSWSEPEREMAAQGAFVLVAWNFFYSYCLDLFLRGVEHAKEVVA